MEMLSPNHTSLPSLADQRARPSWWAGRKFWLGIACSALFLFLAFRNVHWAELGTVLQAVDGRYLLVATVVYPLRLLAGALRWRALLTPLGGLKKREAFAYLTIGHMANNLLPLRAGELIRTILLGERKGFSKSAVLATIVVDRLLDTLVLIAFTVLLMLAMPLPLLVKQSVFVFGGVGGIVMAVLWWVAGHPVSLVTQRSPGTLVSRRLLHLSRLQYTGLWQTVRRLGCSFVGGLVAVRSPEQAGTAVVYSILGWGLGIGFTWLVLRACHLDLPWIAAIMVVVLVNFGAAIPAAPGFIGVVHFLAIVALKPWAVAQSAALGFAIVYHFQGFLLTVGLGVACLILERMSPRVLSGALHVKTTSNA